MNTPLHVEVAGGNNWCGGADNYVQEFWENAPDWNSATILTLTGAEPTMTGIDLTPQIGGTVSGIVTDQDTGLPLAGMPVSLDFNPLPIGYSACTTTHGTYQITGVALDLPFRARAAAAITDDGTNPCGGAGNYVTQHGRIHRTSPKRL